MFIRISGQFTGILQLWLEQRGIRGIIGSERLPDYSPGRAGRSEQPAAAQPAERRE